MVIADNDTRWNSTYLSITRGIKLYAKIQVFSEIHRDELKEDFLLPSDWAVIRDMQHYLSPFWQCTLDLESKATFGSHGTIWEALPAMEFLLHHLETLKDTVPASNKRIRECILNSWSVMRKYYDLTDKSHSIYAAATLLNPLYRMTYFEKNWTGESASWISVMKDTCWNVWKEDYLPYSQAPQPKEPPKKQFDFRLWVESQMEEEPEIDDDADEFQRYTGQRPHKIAKEDKAAFNPITWWSEQRLKFPSLHQFAFDTLACPAMSTECERVFSAAKKTVSSDRNRLSDEVIEACECLKAWWRNGVISGALAATTKTTRKRKVNATEEDKEQAGLRNCERH
jgi:hypothetical protein